MQQHNTKKMANKSLVFHTDKAIPLQTWTGQEGSRRLGLPDFKTIGTWRR